MFEGRTTALDASRCMDTNDHNQSQPSQQRPASSQQSHMVNFCEGLKGLCRDMLWLWSIETNNTRNKKEFLSSEKKRAKPKTKKLRTTFGKSLFLLKYRMHYAIYMSPNTKDLAIKQTMVVYGNRQNATAFERANDSDSLRLLKHLMETKLYTANLCCR